MNIYVIELRVTKKSKLKIIPFSPRISNKTAEEFLKERQEQGKTIKYLGIYKGTTEIINSQIGVFQLIEEGCCTEYLGIATTIYDSLDTIECGHSYAGCNCGACSDDEEEYRMPHSRPNAHGSYFYDWE